VARRIFATACIILLFAATAVSAPAPSKSKGTATRNADVVTYVGCLRVADQGQRFVLTDISGPNAPQARSWKTAYIMKRSIDMDVTGARGVKLRENTGRLVRITGRRSGDDLHAQSIAFAGATCR
jgi:hypothetical protein